MEGQAPTWEKFWVIPGLFLTNLVAITLLTAKAIHWESSLELANFVTTNRSSISIVVQLISHLLGLILVSTLCEL
jgi:hypothetical protein